MDEPREPGLRLVRSDELASRRMQHVSEEYTGIAEREAAALIADAQPVTQANLHTLVTLAWLKGVMFGYGEMLKRIDGQPAADTTPTTERD